MQSGRNPLTMPTDINQGRTPSWGGEGKAGGPAPLVRPSVAHLVLPVPCRACGQAPGCSILASTLADQEPGKWCGPGLVKKGGRRAGGGGGGQGEIP